MCEDQHSSWSACGPCMTCGVADFLRVGALRRVHRRLLPHTLHCSVERQGLKGAAQELQELLKAATSPEDADLLQHELAQVCCHQGTAVCFLGDCSGYPSSPAAAVDWSLSGQG